MMTIIVTVLEHETIENFKTGFKLKYFGFYTNAIITDTSRFVRN